MNIRGEGRINTTLKFSFSNWLAITEMRKIDEQI